MKGFTWIDKHGHSSSGLKKELVISMLDEHIDRLCILYENSPNIKLYLNNIRNYIINDIGDNVFMELNNVITYNQNRKFTSEYNSDQDNSYFSVELWPYDKDMLKYAEYNQSYKQPFTHAYNDVCNKIYNSDSEKIKILTFFHIIILYYNNVMEVHMGIQSDKYNFSLLPTDLCSLQDVSETKFIKVDNKTNEKDKILENDDWICNECETLNGWNKKNCIKCGKLIVK